MWITRQRRDRKKNAINEKNAAISPSVFVFTLSSLILSFTALLRSGRGGSILLILLLSPSLSFSSSSGVFAFFHHQICPRPLPSSLSSLPSFLLITGTPALVNKYKLAFVFVC